MTGLLGMLQLKEGLDLKANLFSTAGGKQREAGLHLLLQRHYFRKAFPGGDLLHRAETLHPAEIHGPDHQGQPPATV